MSESKAHTCLLGFLNITDDGESLELSDDDNKDHVDIWLIDESLCEFESGKESKTDVLRQKSMNFVTKSNILFYFHFFLLIFLTYLQIHSRINYFQLYLIYA